MKLKRKIETYMEYLERKRKADKRRTPCMVTRREWFESAGLKTRDVLSLIVHAPRSRKTNDTRLYRAMTLDEAKALKPGDQIQLVGLSGRVFTARINGQPQTWKRDPSRIRVPWKYGLYEYGAITERDIEYEMVVVEVDRV
jgi:hypothetical protein